MTEVVTDNKLTSILDVDNDKHFLNDRWCMWFMFYENGLDWSENNLQKIYEFQTVEDFWSFFKYLKSPNKLSNGRDLSCFKVDIKPIWEDPPNVNGGSWSIIFHRNDRDQIAQFWEEILMFLISNCVDEDDQCVSDEINGVVVNIRGRGDRINLWTKDSTHEESILKIGRKLKEWLDYQPALGYYSHKDIKDKNFQNPLFTV